MNRFSRRLGIYLPALAVFSVICIVLRSVACFLDLNYTNGYFNSKVLIAIADAFATAGAIFMLSYLVTAKKTSLVASFTTPATYIPSGMVCVALMFLSAHFWVVFKRSNPILLSLKTLKSSQNLLLLLCSALALGCILNFFFTVLIQKKESTVRAAFGILMTVFLCVYSAYLYFDTKLPLNSPCKAVDEMAFLFSALFFCYETRLSLKRDKWNAYVAFGLIASLLTAYSSIPTLILYFARGEMISDSLAGAILAFTMFIYVTARTLAVNTLIDDKCSETVEAIIEYHQRRMKDLELPSYARSSKAPTDAQVGTNYSMDISLPEEKAEEAEEDYSEEGKSADLN